MLMTLHFGRLILILQVNNMVFKAVSLKQITGSPETRWCQMQTKQNSHLLELNKRFLIVRIRSWIRFLRGTKIKEAVNEKLLGVILNKHLDWTNHINYMITKLISRTSLLKTAKNYLPLPLRKLLYNALIKSILEYCCSVWENTTSDNLIRLLRIQKRCARLILDTNV